MRGNIRIAKAWNSRNGGGLSTIHANDFQSGLMKLKQYLVKLVESDQKKIILEAVNLIKNEENNIEIRIYKSLLELRTVMGILKKIFIWNMLLLVGGYILTNNFIIILSAAVMFMISYIVSQKEPLFLDILLKFLQKKDYYNP